MDITDIYQQILKEQHEEKYIQWINVNRIGKNRIISPYVLYCAELMLKLDQMVQEVERKFDDYVDFHRLFDKNKSMMTALERSKLEQEISIFAVSWTTEVNNLKKRILNQRKCQETIHQIEIANFLLLKFQEFTQLTQKMRKLRAKFAISPFKLKISSTSLASKAKFELPTSIVGKNGKEKDINKITVPAKFAERYTDAIAPPSKIKEYEDFAAKHKELLKQESKQLSQKFHEDMVEAVKLESTVTGILDMLSQFATLLQNQSELVEDVHDSSKSATEQVRQTDEQLKQTIDKSTSFQMSMSGLIIFLGLLLLILDYITP